MKTMRYKDYSARIEYSDEDSCFVGHIANIRDIVGFHGKSVDELKKAFQDAVNDYLETCKKTNQPPQKPYSGRLMLRVPPKTHEAISIAASVNGKSINQWASEKLEQAANS